MDRIPVIVRLPPILPAAPLRHYASRIRHIPSGGRLPKGLINHARQLILTTLERITPPDGGLPSEGAKKAVCTNDRDTVPMSSVSITEPMGALLRGEAVGIIAPCGEQLSLGMGMDTGAEE